MKNKFENVPEASDIVILSSNKRQLDQYEVLQETWICEGITANSIIFLNEEVDGLSEGEIIELVKKDPDFKQGSPTNFSRLECGYTFVNFNFNEDGWYFWEDEIDK